MQKIYLLREKRYYHKEKNGMKYTVKFLAQGLIAAFLLVACETYSNPVEPSNARLEKRAVYDAYAGTSNNGDYTLWADFTSQAGIVTLAKTGITITTNAEYDIRGVHIYHWLNEEDISVYRPVPGHADYSLENVHASSITLDIPSSDYNFITVHVALENGVRAYAGGNRYPDGFPDMPGQWWGYVNGFVQPR